MYAAYTVHQDINTVAYKSGILYIQKHNVKRFSKQTKMGFWKGGGRCDVMTCMLKIQKGMSPWKTLPSLFHVEIGPKVDRISLITHIISGQSL